MRIVRPAPLWLDLGAADRGEVSRLMAVHFPAIHAANVRNLRWKRHLFELLGERLGQPGLRPPTCDGCEDFGVCFGAPAALPAEETIEMRRVG